jgi:hypothetical protein
MNLALDLQPTAHSPAARFEEAMRQHDSPVRALPEPSQSASPLGACGARPSLSNIALQEARLRRHRGADLADLKSAQPQRSDKASEMSKAAELCRIAKNAAAPLRSRVVWVRIYDSAN